MGDFNESLFGGRRHALADLCKKHNFWIQFSLQHAKHCDTPTFIHGSHRIDYIVMDEHLMDGCTRCGILPFDPALSPSHRAVFCDISLDAIFGTPAVNLTSSRTRLITPSDQNTCEHLLTILDNAMHNHSLVSRCKSLLINVQETWSNQHKWKDICSH